MCDWNPICRVGESFMLYCFPWRPSTINSEIIWDTNINIVSIVQYILTMGDHILQFNKNWNWSLVCNALCNSAKNNKHSMHYFKISAIAELVKPCMPWHFFRSRSTPTTFILTLQNYSSGIVNKVTQSEHMHQRTNTLPGSNISHLGKNENHQK